jgi:signal transduction histidine kinase
MIGDPAMRKPPSKEPTPIVSERPLADVGELAGPLTHEFNDLLNNLSLHLAVIQHQGSQTMTAELQEVRRQINHVAGVVARFQRRRRRHPEPRSVDVNVALRDAISELRESTEDIHGAELQEVPDGARLEAGVIGIVLDLGDNLPAVLGHMPDVRRLFRFLLSNAVRSVPAVGVSVWARTQRESGNAQVQAIIEDLGARIAVEALPRIFEPGHEQREGMCSLELSACRSIVRRLGGTIEPGLSDEGGLKITVTLPSAP